MHLHILKVALMIMTVACLNACQSDLEGGPAPLNPPQSDPSNPPNPPSVPKAKEIKRYNYAGEEVVFREVLDPAIINALGNGHIVWQLGKVIWGNTALGPDHKHLRQNYHDAIAYCAHRNARMATAAEAIVRREALGAQHIDLASDSNGITQDPGIHSFGPIPGYDNKVFLNESGFFWLMNKYTYYFPSGAIVGDMANTFFPDFGIISSSFIENTELIRCVRDV